MCKDDHFNIVADYFAFLRTIIFRTLTSAYLYDSYFNMHMLNSKKQLYYVLRRVSMVLHKYFTQT
jgi:hypothetical protein